MLINPVLTLQKKIFERNRRKFGEMFFEKPWKISVGRENYNKKLQNAEKNFKHF